MIVLPDSFWIFFIIIVFAIIIKEKAKRASRKLNAADVKLELDAARENLAFTKHASWLMRVSGREAKRLEKRLRYLSRLRKKGVKRFGENSAQVALIDRWIADVRRYIVQFSAISMSAFKTSLGD